MSAVVTIGGLLLGIGLLFAIVVAGIGVLLIFAGGMSSAPAAGEKATRQGCAMATAGLAAAGLLICLLFG